MQERPSPRSTTRYRRYDHRMKGKIPVRMIRQLPFAQGVNEGVTRTSGPSPGRNGQSFYVRGTGRAGAEPFDTESVPPDGFYQPPSVTNKVQSHVSNSCLPEDTVQLDPLDSIHAVIDTDDTN
jgi:hypothetical protein